MTILIILGAVALLAHLGANVHVTRQVAASDYYERAQKAVQIGMAWLIPSLGLVLVWLCLEKPQQQRWSGEDIEPEDVQESADPVMNVPAD